MNAQRTLNQLAFVGAALAACGEVTLLLRALRGHPCFEQRVRQG
jgi:hypothetical protein